MKYGILVDGDAESQAIKLLVRKIPLPKKSTIGMILYADMQPKSTPSQIARKAYSKLSVFPPDHERIIVLIDLENRKECPSNFAELITNAFKKITSTSINTVIKNKKFENWLISDPECFACFKSRYSITDKFRSMIANNKADMIPDAAELINSICIKNSYHKRSDPQKLIDKINIETMALNSRSFRRFLRVIGYTRYKLQSKLP